MRKRTREFIQHLAHDFDESDDEALEPFIDDVLPAIGLVVVNFNMLEKTVDTLICSFISDRSDADGLIVINGMPYSAKIDLLQRFCEDRNRALPVPAPAFAGLLDKLREIGRLRNLVVHADWKSTDSEGYTFHRLKISKGHMQQEYVQLTPDAMEPIIDAIVRLNLQLWRYWEELSEALRG